MKRLISLAAVMTLLAALPARAEELPPDLAAVPGSAVGFAHVRIAEIWKGEALKEIRAIFAKAGPEYLKMLDERFVPAPSTIDRVTVILMLEKETTEPTALAVVTTTTPFDREKLVKSSLTDAKEQKIGAATYYVDSRLGAAIHMASDRMLIVGPAPTLAAYLGRPDKGNGVFAGALKEATGKSSMFLAINAAAVPPALLNEAPPPVRPLLKAGLVQIAIDAGKTPTIDLRVAYANAAGADEAEKGLKELMTLAKQELAKVRKEAEEALFSPSKDKRTALADLPEATASLAALGFIARAEEILNNFPLKRDGNTFAAHIQVPEGPYATAVSTAAVGVGLLLPAVQKVREAAARAKSGNNMKQIGLAFHNYSDVYGSMPPAAICDKQGKPLLSWRVAILPYIEQDNLYKQFHLDEPWDSEHNIKLINRMPVVYQLPVAPPTTGHPSTHYQVFVGNGAGFELKTGLKFPAAFPDGTSNTVWLAEAEKPVPWTKPDDLAYDGKTIPKLGFHWNGGNYVQVGFADGSVRTISRVVPERTWHLLIQRADGQPIPDFDK